MNVYSMVVSGHELFRGDFWQVVWHFLLEESGVNSAYEWAKNILAEVWDAIKDLFLALVPNTCMVDNVTCKRVTGDGGPTAIQGVAENGAAGAMVGGTVAEGARIAWFMVDESHVGATIIPGLPGGSFTDEAFTAGYIGDVQDFIDEITTVFVVGGGGGDCAFMVQNRDNPIEPQIVFAGEIRARPAAIGRRTLR